MLFRSIRSPELNAAVKGSETSDHLTGNAADFIVENFNMEPIFKWIIYESNLNYRQVIFYPDEKFIHISTNIPIKNKKHEALVKLRDGYINAFEYYKKMEAKI